MILQALYQLAQKEKLVDDPDFEWRPVAWLVRIAAGGRLLGIERTHTTPEAPPGGKKPRPMPKSFAVPREPGRTSGDRAFFLFDKAEYALGLDPETDPAKRRPAEKLAARFELFRRRAEECLAATLDEGVKAVCGFLAGVSRGDIAASLPEGCASNDLFAFVYAPDLDRLVTARPAVQAYWRSLRALPEVSADTEQHCLVSGRPAPPVDKHPGIKNVPGGSTSGVALISFNSNAFESYGWTGNDNAPVSREAAEACATALNRLLHPAFPDPSQPGQTLPSRHLRLSEDTAVAFWSATAGAEDDFTLHLGGLLDANPEKVSALYHSLWRGGFQPLDDPAAFYALTLSGSQGRAIVRDWFESTVAQVEKNVARHFADLAIVRNTPPPKGKEHPPALPLRTLLRSLAAGGDDKNIPPSLAGQIVRSALGGIPYPLSILQRALERTRAEIGNTGWSDLERRDARAALIKAVLERRRRRHQALTPYPEVTESMDPTNTSPGYLLGRLMALIERMQQLALGDVNASVVDRFFSSASAAPQSVFPRLMKGLRHHARKAKDEDDRAGFAKSLERQADEILEHVTAFPSFLPLEEQGLFILGYHHQRQWLFLSKEERAQRQAPASLPAEA